MQKLKPFLVMLLFFAGLCLGTVLGRYSEDKPRAAALLWYSTEVDGPPAVGQKFHGYWIRSASREIRLAARCADSGEAPSYALFGEDGITIVDYVMIKPWAWASTVLTPPPVD